MLHKHRILPGHRGGTYEPNNVVLLTVEQHAEAHRILWEKFGYQEDFIAWQGLSGALDRESIIARTLSMAGKRGGRAGKGVTRNKGNARPDVAARNALGLTKGTPKSEEHKQKIREAAIRRWSNPIERQRQSERLKRLT